MSSDVTPAQSWSAALLGGVGLIVVSAAACAPPATVGGAPATSAGPASAWPGAPGAARRPATYGATSGAGGAIASTAAAHLQALTIADAVDLALANNPQTRVSWTQARAAAAVYASARGRLLPSLDGSVSGGPVRSVSQNPARIPSDRTSTTMSAQLQYVLFDFGARGGAMAAAHEALFAADFTHNATLQNVALQAELAYFNYQATLGLRDASRATVATATANLAAAEQRHDVGLATIADVLQARTALGQARLGEQSAEGAVQAARATLAAACGLDANAAFDVAADTTAAAAPALVEGVDSVITRAVRDRPDLAAARASARQSEQLVRVARSAALPSVTVGANRGEVYSNNRALEGQTYAIAFGLTVPIFSGLSRESDIAAARENAAAAAARSEQARVTAVAQVFTSYYAVRTAAQRVATAADLLASATQSEEVARGRYSEGVGSILDLLAAQNALADARAQAVQARWTLRAALAQLAHDAGEYGK